MPPQSQNTTQPQRVGNEPARGNQEVTGPDSPRIRMEIEGPLARLWLDRPPLNILDLQALDELGQASERLTQLSDVRVVVLRGAGERAFSAGVAIEDHRRATIAPMLQRFHRALHLLRELPAVVVAVVQGHCLGGGLELACACDLVIATEGSSFGQPEIQLACFPPWATATLPARIGQARAAHLILTGRRLDAEQAETMGLISRRVAQSDLDGEQESLVQQLLGYSGAALALTKRALRAGNEQPFSQALSEAERLYLDELSQSQDMEEGVEAFLARRPPRWQHG